MFPLNAPHLEQLQQEGISISELSIKKRFDLAAIKTIRAYIKNHHIDIIHTFNNQAAVNGYLATLFLDTKIIMYRGIVANVSFLNPSSWLSYLNPKVSRVICVANAIRDYFRNMSFLGLRQRRDKFITIYKGHDLAWYQNRPASLAEFNIPEGAFVVGCIANSRRRKGLEYLIRSAKWIEPGKNIHYLLIGHMDADYLKEEYEKSPARDRIHFAGYRSDASALIAACQASALPSIRREGLPKSVIESMVYAIPAIVTDSGGSPELIEHEVSGMIVPPADDKAIAEAIQFLHDNDELRQKMGANARHRISEKFNIEQTIQQTYELYCQVMKE
jgi:glycosyltransferase involved in cell wall biosynthesis